MDIRLVDTEALGRKKLARSFGSKRQVMLAHI